MKQYKSKLSEWNAYKQRIIIRADLNVPTHNGLILNDAKLHDILPTLDYLIKQKSIITLITHIGRPKNSDPMLSTRILMPWFTQHKYNVRHATTLSKLEQLTHSVQPGTIILYENIRFFDEETSGNLLFARTLKKCGTYYVQEAFASLHRMDTSITLLPTLFTPECKTIGFHTEQELNKLTQMVSHYEKPFVWVLGGSKIKSKLSYMYDALDIVDTFIICPALAFTFLQAQGVSVGTSLVDTTMLTKAATLLKRAKEKNVTILLPIDVLIAYNLTNSPYTVVPINAIPSQAFGITIGPKSIDLFKSIIPTAKTILYNGPMGFLEKPKTYHNTCQLLNIITTSNATTIIAGGDSVAAADHCSMSDFFTYKFTAGGAVLYYSVYKQFPALEALNK